jgi:hypothetical protein
MPYNPYLADLAGNANRYVQLRDGLREIIDHARKISPSPAMTVNVTQLENLLNGTNEPVHHKTGGGETRAT